MSNSDQPTVNIAELHEAIKTGLRKVFTTADVPTIDYYTKTGNAITSPAIFFELDECEPAGDVGTGQFVTDLQFSAWVVVTLDNYTMAHIAVRALALSVAAAINGMKWGQCVSPAVITRCEPAEFRNESTSAYLAYLVSWKHGAVVGTSTWDADKLGITPSTVFLGLSPDIGAAHENDYEQVSK